MSKTNRWRRLPVMHGGLPVILDQSTGDVLGEDVVTGKLHDLPLDVAAAVKTWMLERAEVDQ